MKLDPIVEEVRAAREAHARKFNFNMADICSALKQKEKMFAHRVVSRNPKMLEKKTGS